MKNLVISLAVIAAVGLSASPSFAGSTQDQVTLCADEAKAQGLAPSSDFRAKFISLKGASLKTVKVKLIPTGEGESREIECRVKGDKVIEATVKS